MPTGGLGAVAKLPRGSSWELPTMGLSQSAVYSLAIMTDAAHLLSDVSGFAVALFAAYYSAKKSKSSHTFGYAPLWANRTIACWQWSRAHACMYHHRGLCSRTPGRSIALCDASLC